MASWVRWKSPHSSLLHWKVGMRRDRRCQRVKLSVSELFQLACWRELLGIVERMLPLRWQERGWGIGGNISWWDWVAWTVTLSAGGLRRAWDLKEEGRRWQHWGWDVLEVNIVCVCSHWLLSYLWLVEVSIKLVLKVGSLDGEGGQGGGGLAGGDPWQGEASKRGRRREERRALNLMKPMSIRALHP